MVDRGEMDTFKWGNYWFFWAWTVEGFAGYLDQLDIGLWENRSRLCRLQTYPGLGGSSGCQPYFGLNANGNSVAWLENGGQSAKRPWKTFLVFRLGRDPITVLYPFIESSFSGSLKTYWMMSLLGKDGRRKSSIESVRRRKNGENRSSRNETRKRQVLINCMKWKKNYKDTLLLEELLEVWWVTNRGRRVHLRLCLCRNPLSWSATTPAKFSSLSSSKQHQKSFLGVYNKCPLRPRHLSTV